MDVLVLLEECDDHAATVGRAAPAGAPAERPIAYVHSAPGARSWGGRSWGGRFEAHGAWPNRDVVTLCGEVDAARLALALAAAIEGRHADAGSPDGAVRHLAVWPAVGAAGDAAWHDAGSGEVRSRDVAIPAATLEATARRLLADAGRLLQQTVAELSTPDWPEGARRAISFALPLTGDRPTGRLGIADETADAALLASLREADGEGPGDADADEADLASHLAPARRAELAA